MAKLLVPVNMPTSSIFFAPAHQQACMHRVIGRSQLLVCKMLQACVGQACLLQKTGSATRRHPMCRRCAAVCHVTLTCCSHQHLEEPALKAAGAALLLLLKQGLALQHQKAKCIRAVLAHCQLHQQAAVRILTCVCTACQSCSKDALISSCTAWGGWLLCCSR